MKGLLTLHIIHNQIIMNRYFFIIFLGVLLTACSSSEERLHQRAAELCRYIPDCEELERSREYLTSDFYAVLDTLFYRLPEHEAMDHEWSHYFAADNGETIADCEVIEVKQTDPSHAVATIKVRQEREDDSRAEENCTEEHRLYMEKENGIWLISDFDEHKQDCIRHIEINRQEQAVRDAISDYLVKEEGIHYSPGELCIPTLMLVASEEVDSVQARVWGDFWIFWYTKSCDTLKTVSGGNHSGCMSLTRQEGKLSVTSFEQTVDGSGNVASAKRIFGPHYDVFQKMHSNSDVREAVRKEQLQDYIRLNGLNIKYYQDYGWDAVELFVKE